MIRSQIKLHGEFQNSFGYRMRLLSYVREAAGHRNKHCDKERPAEVPHCNSELQGLGQTAAIKD